MNNRISILGAPRHLLLRNLIMNNTLRFTLAAALFTVAHGAFAHDPAEHAKEAEEAKAKANCDAMKKMDMSKLDPNDAVMKAMMVKCSAAKKPDGMKGGDMKGMKMDMPANTAKTPDTHEGH